MGGFMNWVRTFLAISVFCIGLAQAHDHKAQLGEIKGDKVSLHYTDHAMAGQVNGRLVYAAPLSSEFGIKLIYRADGKEFSSDFKKVGASFTAKVNETDFALTRVSAKEGIIEGVLGKDPFKIVLSAKSMEGNHYVNPQFDVTLPGKTYSFRLENGMACIGCATKISFVVLAMLRSSGAL